MTRSYWQYLAIFYRIAAQTNQNEGLFAPETLKDSILIFNHSQISQDGESRRRIYRAFRASLPSNYLTMQPSNHANHQPIQLPNHPTYLTMEQSNYQLHYPTIQLDNHPSIHYPTIQSSTIHFPNIQFSKYPIYIQAICHPLRSHNWQRKSSTVSVKVSEQNVLCILKSTLNCQYCIWRSRMYDP